MSNAPHALVGAKGYETRGRNSSLPRSTSAIVLKKSEWTAIAVIAVALSVAGYRSFTAATFEDYVLANLPTILFFVLLIATAAAFVYERAAPLILVGVLWIAAVVALVLRLAA